MEFAWVDEGETWWSVRKCSWNKYRHWVYLGGGENLDIVISKISSTKN